MNIQTPSPGLLRFVQSLVSLQWPLRRIGFSFGGFKPWLEENQRDPVRRGSGRHLDSSLLARNLLMLDGEEHRRVRAS